MAMNNVDIKITQKGYTKVPIVKVNKLKVNSATIIFNSNLKT